jgi:hypothetical protein
MEAPDNSGPAALPALVAVGIIALFVALSIGTYLLLSQ